MLFIPILLALVALLRECGAAQSQSYGSGTYSIIVPASVWHLMVTLQGSYGGGDCGNTSGGFAYPCHASGGLGCILTVTLSTTPGETLTLVVGSSVSISRGGTVLAQADNGGRPTSCGDYNSNNCVNGAAGSCHPYSAVVTDNKPGGNNGASSATIIYSVDTSAPTGSPTGQPSGSPTRRPSSQPSALPTRNPTGLNPRVYSWEGGLIRKDAASNMSSVQHTFTNLGDYSSFGPVFYYVSVEVYGTGFGRNHSQYVSSSTMSTSGQRYALSSGCSDQGNCKHGYVTCALNHEAHSDVSTLNGGQLTMEATAVGFDSSSCLYKDSYWLYVRFNVSVGLPLPTKSPVTSLVILGSQADAYVFAGITQGPGALIASLIMLGLSLVVSLLLHNLRNSNPTTSASIVSLPLWLITLDIVLLNNGFITEILLLVVVLSNGSDSAYFSIGVAMIVGRLLHHVPAVVIIYRILGPRRISRRYLALMDESHFLENSTVYGLITMLTLVELPYLRYLPWFASSFSKGSRGLPDMFAVRSVTFTKLLQTAVTVVCQTTYLVLINRNAVSNGLHSISPLSLAVFSIGIVSSLFVFAMSLVEGLFRNRLLLEMSLINQKQLQAELEKVEDAKVADALARIAAIDPNAYALFRTIILDNETLRLQNVQLRDQVVAASASQPTDGKAGGGRATFSSMLGFRQSSQSMPLDIIPPPPRLSHAAVPNPLTVTSTNEGL